MPNQKNKKPFVLPHILITSIVISFLLLFGPSGLSRQQAQAQAETATYEIRFESTWSETTHPVTFPPDPHFSPLIGGTHNDQVTLWARDSLASAGIEQMAETGGTTNLRNEVNAAISAGDADQIVSGGGIPQSPNSVTISSVEVSRDFPLISLVTMIAPSPDWFVGVNSLSLLDQTDEWHTELQVELFAYDAGTDSGSDYTSGNDDTNPAEPITRFAHNNDPFSAASLGTFTFTRLDQPEPTATPTETPEPVEPTATPTLVPTGTPTAEPTAAPTENPTVIPTATPNPVETAEPTETPDPAAPTETPEPISSTVTPDPAATATPEGTAQDFELFLPLIDTEGGTAEPSATITPVPSPSGTVSPTPTATSIPLNCLSTDAEPNNSSGEAFENGPTCTNITLSGSLSETDDRDLYFLTFDSQVGLRLYLDGYPAESNFNLALFRSDGTLVDNQGVVAPWKEILEIIEADGYLISVDRESGVGDYDLLIEIEAP